MRSPLTPLEFLARSAEVYADRIAAVDGDRRFTYAEFHRRVHKLASALRRRGIGPGDSVAMLAPNTIAALEAHFGVMLAGAVLVMLNTRLQASEIAWILNHCKARALLLDPQCTAVEASNLRFTVTDYEGLLAEGEFPFAAAPV